MQTHPTLPAASAARPRGLALAAVALLLGCSGDPKTPGRQEDPQDTVSGGGGGDDTGGDREVVASWRAPWVRQETETPGSITFNEIFYHPDDDAGPEWVELYNPMALDLDLSGWALDGGVSYPFEEGTVIAAGGFLVVAADPGLVSGALGPYDGRLDNSGERLDLRNNSDRLIDSVAFGTDDPWPVAADGSGFSLSKIDADAASDRAENWTVSAERGGTPGASNRLDPLTQVRTETLVALESTWTYDLSGAYPAADWAEADYDDRDWATGEAVFYAGDALEDALATAFVTADNYYGLYLGQADGSDLRLVGEDPDGDWTTVDDFDLEVGPLDHLYIAAWEAPWDYGGPQMTIGEVELPDDVVGTDSEAFEWILGPTGGCPGTTPTDPPPDAATLAALVADAEADGSWALPAVEADRSSSPWGWATASAFSAAAKYIWADTFSDTSVTNTQNTYALFRSIEPLLASRGSTELSSVPTTILFRARFTLDADPAATTLSLSCLLDDGAVFSLNGVEVLRENLPSGSVTASTLASTAVGDAEEFTADLSSEALVRGENVLAVEVHQAAPDDLDMTFGCALSARISAASGASTVLINELPPATEAPFWVELINVSAADQALGDLVLASSSGAEVDLPLQTLEPGEILVIDDLDLPVEDGDRLFLTSADRSALLDAVRVRDGDRARDADGGPWRTPATSTPGEANDIRLTDDVVINEIQYHHAPRSIEGEAVADVPEEWIELYNRGDEAVDLSGWQLVDAVAFEIPDGTVLAPDGYLVIAGDAASLSAGSPDLAVIGDFTGRLDNGSDRILLLDAHGNPADEVRYYDGGRWPEAADGGGSSLELKDPWADNRAAEAWAASEEGAAAPWVEVRTRGEADASAVGPDGRWEELVLGLLDGGEVLIDDLSVVQDPDSAPVELIQNGSFDAGDAHWRLLGNHRHSAIVPDPDDPSNAVLRLVATGATGHMHNHAETTLLRAVSDREYEISYRARWVSGSNQVNTRLYFNRLPHTARIEQPAGSGTPGARNSTAVDNLGPTFADLAQDVAVPAAGEAVQISVSVADPDGVEDVTLWSSVAGADFEAQDMAEDEDGRWSAWLDGQAAGAIVQFYVEATDARGAASTFPAAGPDARALIKFDDGEAESNGLHNLRILLTEADSDWLHDDVNLMSDDLVGATVVYDESEVFYDVGVRAKGSERGRPEVARLGYGLRFHPEQPFRGSHTSALIDRSEGVGYGQREVLMNLVMTRAGSVSGEYNDLVQALTPLPEHTGPAELQLDRFSDLVLASQFEDGDSGPLFEYELIYYPLTTDDGTAEGLKLPQPDYVVGTYITDLGDDQESYRWNFLIQNNEREDDYTRLMDLGQTFALSGADFLAEADAVIDVDQWLRAFAFATLSGAVDNYGSDNSQHNARFYVRPSDGRVLYFPHDLDFFGSATMSVIGNSDLARLIDDPANLRLYYGHLQDIIARAYTTDYLAPWCAQLGALLPAQDFETSCAFIDTRADWVMTGSSDAVMKRFPAVDFHITTGGGADLTVSDTTVTLEGEAWVDVRQIVLNGDDTPLPLTWLDKKTWQVTVPLAAGVNDLALVAQDLRGATVGVDEIAVTSTAR